MSWGWGYELAEQARNEILTHSFEVDTDADGRADDWLEWSAPVFAMETSIVLQGSKSQKITTDALDEGIYQTGMVAPAGTTKAVAYAWVCRPAAGADIKINLYDVTASALRDQQLLSTGGWEEKTVGGYTWYRIVVSSNAIVAGNNHRIMILVKAATATVYYVDLAFWKWGTNTL